MRFDRTDNATEPSFGWFAQGASEVGFMGDVRLWKNSVEAKRFWVVHRDDEERDHVLSIGGQFAYAQPFSSSEELHAME